MHAFSQSYGIRHLQAKLNPMSLIVVSLMSAVVFPVLAFAAGVASSTQAVAAMVTRINYILQQRTLQKNIQGEADTACGACPTEESVLITTPSPSLRD